MAILEDAVRGRSHLSPAEVLSEVAALELRTPDEAVHVVRRDRDER